MLQKCECVSSASFHCALLLWYRDVLAWFIVTSAGTEMLRGVVNFSKIFAYTFTAGWVLFNIGHWVVVAAYFWVANSWHASDWGALINFALTAASRQPHLTFIILQASLTSSRIHQPFCFVMSAFNNRCGCASWLLCSATCDTQLPHGQRTAAMCQWQILASRCKHRLDVAPRPSVQHCLPGFRGHAHAHSIQL